jgi:hypothetical protein
VTRFLSYKAPLLDTAGFAAVRGLHGRAWASTHPAQPTCACFRGGVGGVGAQKLDAAGLAHAPDAARGALNALVYIFRSAPPTPHTH